MRSLEAKIVVLGAQGVGKTSVVVRYVSSSFNKHVSPTIGASFFTCNMQMDNYRVKLQVWDTAGQERFRSMAPMYYRKANAAMLVYDIANRDTFDDMKIWVGELRKHVNTRLAVCVLGNKMDLENQRKVPQEDAEDYAASIGAMYFETSAISNQGIEDVFVHISQTLVKEYESDPNSDLHVMDSYNSSHVNSDSYASGGEKIDLNASVSNDTSAGAGNKTWSCCSS